MLIVQMVEWMQLDNIVPSMVIVNMILSIAVERDSHRQFANAEINKCNAWLCHVRHAQRHDQHTESLWIQLLVPRLSQQKQNDQPVQLI